ncbi:HET-domain-containing protein [Diaporthe amygdali]|uniref:HET-domain-containing protein n=1 Tax=Phomopsis amygdali TaxID=1214568 RepID=UPI0022FEF448|nr:HET-domain-containing protein [Diaporthe amygdali]KAJ0114919.1 HET-domain-containing protein [Diaporthe amygdali]
MSFNIWDLFAKAWHFKLPAFGMDQLLPICKTYTFSFGFWIRLTSEGTDSRVTSTAMRETPVRYAPLEHEYDLRLFFLHPGSDDDIVTGHMECRGMEQPRKEFEALSYVWGATDDCAIILIDDTSVSVTKSLEAALRHLRFPDRPRTLWIDYVCINQHDIDERNRQVAMMGSIYWQAITVLVWLGEATPDTAAGIKVLSYLANEPRPQPRPVWQDYPPSVVRAGLLDIMNRPWFQRMWVVQEIGRSSSASLICGRHEVKWQSNDCITVKRFVRMIKYAEISPQWEHMGLGTVNMQPLLDMLDLQIGEQLDRSWGGTHRSAPDFLDIAHSMRHKLCSDPRDKLFGIYGIVEHSLHNEDFKPDYTMTVGQMYEALARLAFA